LGLVPEEPGLADVIAEQRELLSRLRAVVEAKDAENQVLRAELDAARERERRLGLRLAELERRLRMDSTDSGTPTSKEPIGARERRRAERQESERERRKDRRRGGQPGHPGRGLALCAAIRKQARAYPSWFWDFLDKEREATVIKEFEALAIPGLFQTEDYAHALFRACKLGVDDEEIGKHVAGRLERQQILTRARPPMMWVVLDEAMIRRPVGGPQVMYDQLAHFTEVAGRPRVVLQIMPFSAGGHAGLMGAFMLLTLGSGQEVAYTESAGSSQLIERPEDVEPFVLAFDTLRAQALSPDASIDLIDQVMKDIAS